MLRIHDLEHLSVGSCYIQPYFKQGGVHDDISSTVKKNINFFFLFFENSYSGHHRHEILISAWRLEV